MTTINHEIERLTVVAKQTLNATDEQIQKGFELHKKLFTSDLFGFLPRTISKAGYEHVVRTVQNGASREYASKTWANTIAFSPVRDVESRMRLKAVIEAAGVRCTVETTGSEGSLHDSLTRIALHQYLYDSLPDLFRKATCVADIRRAVEAGIMAVICSTNAPPANGGLEDFKDAHKWIENFYRLGIRIMHLTYNRRNWVGDGCMEPANSGLSLHGRDVVKQLNDLGMVVDTAHSGERTTIEAAKLSRVPIMATHAACRQVHNHPRGKSDEALKAIAEGGGLIGICVIANFLGGQGSVLDLMRHIEHAVNLVGPDHVAIGSDIAFAWPPAAHHVVIPDFPKPSPNLSGRDTGQGAWGQASWLPQHDSVELVNWPYFTVGLVKLGYSEDDIAKILGGNLLRVLGEVERIGNRDW